MSDDSNNRPPPPIMRDEPAAEQMKQWRDLVEEKLGDSPFRVVGLKADPNGKLLAVLELKDLDQN